MVSYLSWAANAVLFVLACFLAADTGNAVFASMLTEDVVATPLPDPVEGRKAAAWPDRQIIVDRNLFNSASAGGASQELLIEEDIEATKLPLKLLGTAAADDPVYAWAAVQDEETRETLVVTIDDVLKGKARVVRIERRRIVLSEDGEARELTFGDEEAPPSAITRARARPPLRQSRARQRPRARAQAARPSPRVTQVADNRFSLPREDAENALNDPADILSQARFLPKYDGESMVGFQVNSIKQESVLRKFGLQDGDVITDFNGIAIDSPSESARLLDEFNSSPRISLGVIKAGGETTIIDVDLSE